MKYVDIHTHALTHDPRIIEVQSLDPRIPVELSMPRSEHFCFGLHPWYVDEIEENLFFTGLKTCLQSPAFFALGEIGVDRARSENLERQMELFRKQLELAAKFRIERIVIHCVKAYFDILPELQALKWKPVIILHDFNSNMETVEKFLESTNTYFSFGAKLFNANTKAHKTFTQIPLERAFLETDDQLDKSILDIYQEAAKIRGINESDLIEQLNKNYQNIAPLGLD